MTQHFLAPSSPRRTKLLFCGLALIALGGVTTYAVGNPGLGFLCLVLGSILIMNRVNFLIAIFAGVMLSVVMLAPFLRLQHQREEQEKAVQKARAFQEAAKRAREEEQALVESFPQQKPTFEADLSALEQLVRHGNWNEAEAAARKLATTLTRFVRSPIGTSVEVQTLWKRFDATHKVILEKVEAIRKEEAARQAVERLAQRDREAAQLFGVLKALLNDYKNNEIGADKRYKGRSLRLAGIVGDIKKDILDQPFVTLGTGSDFEIPMVQCFLADKSVQRASRLSKGQMITVEGRVDGLMFNVLMKQCVIQ